MPKHLLKSWKQKSGPAGAAGISLGRRLFVFLTAVVLTIIFGVIAILLLTGTFTAGLAESEKMLGNELAHASSEISRQYGLISLQTIDFAEKLAASIEANAGRLGIPAAGLKEHPEMLEEIISSEYERALFFLQLSKCSGIFFILDATVNPSLESASVSRAGLYLKNMEPNIISSSTPNILLLRGFPAIGRHNALHLHSQWTMEFDISEAPYYHKPMDAAAANPTLPPSRLYYWNGALTLPGTSEEIMICSAPLVDAQGNVFGVCGFEVSAMLFKLTHMPVNSNYSRLFCVLAPVRKDSLNLQRSLLAGGYSARVAARDRTMLQIIKNRRYFYSYRGSQSTYLGLHEPVELYPEGSVFTGEQWAVAIMIPQEDIVEAATYLNVLLISLLTLLVIAGVISSFVLGQKLFIKPITSGLDLLKTENLAAAPKTKIPELDGLIEFLSVRNKELSQKVKQENISLALLDQFMENMEQLSSAERAVFDLYAEGYTAKEIAQQLCLSINTIKTHSKRIYAKLNVASREELLLYVQMLKETGRKS
ncbi:MAG TPA: LuxR C-terminal-related transcriptional regulator [Bacillota bacterium]|nr:LuxR C-terminal-related transcriptional regulator [Bacillota bacterium]